jgi:general secretion pathway protein C
MLNRIIQGPQGERGPVLVVVGVLAVLCLWLAIRLFATLLDHGTADDPSDLPAVDVALLAAPQESVAGWHLFGSAVGTTDPRQQAAQAPETDQSLVLVGVLALDDPAIGIAMIADDSGDQRAYRVGQSLPGGSALRGVFADRVLLDRGGREESLSLRQPETPAAGAAAAAPGSAAAPMAMIAPGGPVIANAATVDWADVRKQLETDPEQLARQVRVMPVIEGGTVVGMRLSGGAAAPLIARAGLRPDDVVTAVNGISVRDVGRAQQILASVRSADRVSVTVRRDGQEQTLNVDLRQP